MFSPTPPPPPSPTRRGVFHLQCQKSHPRAPTTTRLWPEIVHWRAQRNSGRRPGSAWWLPKELRPYGKTQPRRALTALRSTYLRLRHGYEDITRGTHRADKQCYTKHNTTKNVWLSTPMHSRGVIELDALFGYAHLVTWIFALLF